MENKELEVDLKNESMSNCQDHNKANDENTILRKQAFEKSLQRVVKYEELSRIMFMIGVVVIVLSFVLSSIFPYLRTQTKEIDFKKYNQSLSKGTYTYIDVAGGIHLGTVVQTEKYGVVEVSSTNIGYFMVYDTNGELGIVEVKGNDINTFMLQVGNSKDAVRYYGNIVGGLDDIDLDYEALAEGALFGDDILQELENASDNRDNFVDTVNKYKILSCDLDMSMTKQVKVFGPGLIFVIIAGCFFIAMFVFKYIVSKLEEQNWSEL